MWIGIEVATIFEDNGCFESQNIGAQDSDIVADGTFGDFFVNTTFFAQSFGTFFLQTADGALDVAVLQATINSLIANKGVEIRWYKKDFSLQKGCNGVG